MISRLDRPSLESPFDVAASLGWLAMRIMTMRHRAALASRSPPAVQPMTGVDFAAGGGDRRGSAEPGEAGFAA